TDIMIAKFALNLECLEAEFYSYAAFGYGLSDELRGYGPEPIGGMKAALSPDVQAYAEEVARNEIAHVGVLRAALGDAAPACPQIDIGPAFAAAANAAVGTTLSPPYSPYYNDAWFLLGSFIFEDVGVTAYNGAAPLLTNKAIVGTAASILAVEAYHGGEIRTLLYQQEDQQLTPYTVTVGDAVTAISALRAKVGGGKDQGLTTDGMLSLTPADDNALAYAREAEEVLAIVYLGSSDKPGGFFPCGIN
ncbi:ferritin-like domain-containing protein, partial [Tribonema minus]